MMEAGIFHHPVVFLTTIISLSISCQASFMGGSTDRNKGLSKSDPINIATATLGDDQVGGFGFHLSPTYFSLYQDSSSSVTSDSMTEGKSVVSQTPKTKKTFSKTEKVPRRRASNEETSSKRLSSALSGSASAPTMWNPRSFKIKVHESPPTSKSGRSKTSEKGTAPTSRKFIQISPKESPTTGSPELKKNLISSSPSRFDISIRQKNFAEKKLCEMNGDSPRTYENSMSDASESCSISPCSTPKARRSSSFKALITRRRSEGSDVEEKKREMFEVKSSKPKSLLSKLTRSSGSGDDKDATSSCSIDDCEFGNLRQRSCKKYEIKQKSDGHEDKNRSPFRNYLYNREKLHQLLVACEDALVESAAAHDIHPESQCLEEYTEMLKNPDTAALWDPKICIPILIKSIFLADSPGTFIDLSNGLFFGPDEMMQALYLVAAEDERRLMDGEPMVDMSEYRYSLPFTWFASLVTEMDYQNARIFYLAFDIYLPKQFRKRMRNSGGNIFEALYGKPDRIESNKR